jgi:acid phosphatase family membrane protein YuiD
MLNTGVIALLSGLLAQAAKVVLEAVLKRRFRPSLFFTNGGMPSSHSATVTTLSLAVGRAEGFNSSIFSLVLVFSLYVIFEATGLRQEIGKQAELLNDLMDSALAGEKFPGDRLRELMGHTWGEVAGGIAFGTAVYLWLGIPEGI